MCYEHETNDEKLKGIEKRKKTLKVISIKIDFFVQNKNHR